MSVHNRSDYWGFYDKKERKDVYDIANSVVVGWGDEFGIFFLERKERD